MSSTDFATCGKGMQLLVNSSPYALVDQLITSFAVRFIGKRGGYPLGRWENIAGSHLRTMPGKQIVRIKQRGPTNDPQPFIKSSKTGLFETTASVCILSEILLTIQNAKGQLSGGSYPFQWHVQT